MFGVVITEKGGAQRRLEFDKNEVTIGRVQGNDIILPKGNVSKRHSRIVLKDNRFIVVDLKSTNGTYVNGRKITSPLVVKAGDKIYIGDFILTLEEGEGAGAGAAPPAPEPAPMPAPAPPGPAPAPAARPSAPPPLPSRGAPPGPAPMPAPAPAPQMSPAPAPMAPAPQPGPAPAPMAPAPAPQMSPAPAPMAPAPAPQMSPAPAPQMSPAPAPTPAAPAAQYNPPPAAPAPEADRFPLEDEPSGNDASDGPSPRIVGGSSPSSSPTPQPGPSVSRPPAAASAGGGLDFWQSLVVAAVSSGKDARAAMSLADEVVSKSQN